MDLNKTGRLITMRRKQMNLTQEELSEKLGVTSSAVSAWVTGKNYPDASSQASSLQFMRIKLRSRSILPVEP